MSGVNIEYKGESIATIPDTGSKTIKTQGKYCEGDILVEYEAPPFPQPTLITKQITENGTYTAEDDNADGYSEVTVAVPTPTFESKAVTPMAIRFDVEPSEGFDGLSKVTVNATPLEEKTIIPTSQQQVVTPTAPNIGFSSVTVETPSEEIKNINLDAYIKRELTSVSTSATVIPADCFYNNSIITIVNMANVLDIGAAAFSGCTSLALTSLPSGVTSVGRDAFRNCTNLALTSLPSGLTDISVAAFSGCTNLALTSLPDGMTVINIDTFSNCTNLALASLPSGIRSIGNYAFSGCRNITLNKLPATVTSIGNNAFKNCTGIPYLDFSDFDHIPTIYSTTFVGTTFPFYFADQTQLDAFASATNWSTYADRFQSKPSGV